MRYLRVHWNHHHPDEPVEMYSEIDDQSWELRKVEFFLDGRVGYAGPHESTESTRLSLEPLPSLEEIAADPQFVPEEISQDEFESVWEAARHVGHPG